MRISLPRWAKKENLEYHVKQALDKRVDLPSGGFLVIEPTESADRD